MFPLQPEGRVQQPYAPEDVSWGEPTIDPIARVLPWIGQINPYTDNRFKMWHGRALGAAEATESTGVGEPTHGQFMREMEHQDDVYGSGIFDSYGRGPTIHPDLGVFGDHPSLPGYIEREIQFAASTEIADIANGAQVVVVPGGGMTYQERDGRIVQYDRFGPIPPAPNYQPAHIPTGRAQIYAQMPSDPRRQRDQPYTYLDRNMLHARISRLRDIEEAPMPGRANTGLRASTVAAMQLRQGLVAAATRTVDSAERALLHVRRPTVPEDQTVRTITGPVRPQPSQGGIRTQQIVDAPLWGQPIPMARGQAVAVSPAPIPVRMAPGRPVPAAPPPRPISGYGAESDAAPGIGTYAFAGLLVGVAAAMVMGATRMKTKGAK
jgi:hypothetical protein